MSTKSRGSLPYSYPHHRIIHLTYTSYSYTQYGLSPPSQFPFPSHSHSKEKKKIRRNKAVSEETEWGLIPRIGCMCMCIDSWPLGSLQSYPVPLAPFSLPDLLVHCVQVP